MVINNFEAMQVMNHFARRNAFIATFKENKKKEEFIRELAEVNKAIERVSVYQVIPGQIDIPDDAYIVCCSSENLIYWEGFYHEYYALNEDNQRNSEKLRIGYVDKAYVPTLTKVRFVLVTDGEESKIVMI